MDNNSFLHIIKNNVVKFDPQAQVILYGSRARGDFRQDSDWDVLVILYLNEVEAMKENIRNELFLTEMEYNQTISSIIYSKKAWDKLRITPLHKNIDMEGIIL